MGKYHKEWARRRRALLFDVLGNKCAHHKKGNCKGSLTVDCIIPQGDRHHKMDTSARQSFYHRQLKLNNLQLLCEYHQGLKGRREKDRQDLQFHSSPPTVEITIKICNEPEQPF